MIDVFTSEGPILPWSIILKVPAAISSREIIRNHWGEKSSYMQKKKKNRKVAKLGETCHSNEPCRWGFSKGQFALREILFVLQKNLSTRNPFQCERFVWPTKIFASATKLQRYRQLALEVYNFLSDEKIYCSLTDTLQLVIIFRNWYQAKWYYVRVFSLWTC